MNARSSGACQSRHVCDPKPYPGCSDTVIFPSYRVIANVDIIRKTDDTVYGGNIIQTNRQLGGIAVFTLSPKV